MIKWMFWFIQSEPEIEFSRADQREVADQSKVKGWNSYLFYKWWNSSSSYMPMQPNSFIAYKCNQDTTINEINIFPNSKWTFIFTSLAVC